jgi:hypothetical protein
MEARLNDGLLTPNSVPIFTPFNLQNNRGEGALLFRARVGSGPVCRQRQVCKVRGFRPRFGSCCGGPNVTCCPSPTYHAKEPTVCDPEHQNGKRARPWGIMTKRLSKAERVDIRARQIAWQEAYKAHKAEHPYAAEVECRRAATERCWRIVMIPPYRLPNDDSRTTDDRRHWSRFSLYQDFASLREQSD